MEEPSGARLRLSLRVLRAHVPLDVLEVAMALRAHAVDDSVAQLGDLALGGALAVLGGRALRVGELQLLRPALQLLADLLQLRLRPTEGMPTRAIEHLRATAFFPDSAVYRSRHGERRAAPALDVGERDFNDLRQTHVPSFRPRARRARACAAEPSDQPPASRSWTAGR